MENRGPHQKSFRDPRFRKSVAMGIFSLLLAGCAAALAQRYINQASGNPVGDLVLDNLPNFPWPILLFDFLILGSVFVACSILFVTLANPAYLPFTLKTIALLYFVRAFFVSLTHLKVSPDKIMFDRWGILAKFIYGGNDLFFSGHVALPFVAALIFWKMKFARCYFLSAAAIFALATLFARSHYSIDVFVVPFVGYGVFVIARKLFQKDYLTARLNT